MVSRTVLALMVGGNGGEALPERLFMIDPMHVVRLEPINGEGQAESGN